MLQSVDKVTGVVAYFCQSFLSSYKVTDVVLASTCHTVFMRRPELCRLENVVHCS